ncbi:MAG TPA: RHS repeat-associated core domain-containing protein [Gemmataceae bacterium]|nr:RHS repeat-associated core domain-containing protein [Gemmataceae bacterium]
MFNPVTGRFLSVDPRSPDGVDLLYEHPFVYARNNPVNWVDPTGEQARKLEDCEKCLVAIFQNAVFALTPAEFDGVTNAAIEVFPKGFRMGAPSPQSRLAL